MTDDDQKIEALAIISAEQQSQENLDMHIKIYSPYRTYFDDTGYSVSAVNASGAFDILARHHKFISLLLPCELQVRSRRGDVKIRISSGLMRVKSDQVIVFLDV